MLQQKEYDGTEEKALQKEEEERKWQEEYGKKIPFYVQQINERLCKKDRESRMKVRDMFLDKAFFEPYKQTDVFATLYVVMSIYEMEDKAQISKTILDQGDTAESLLDYIFELKMILYRLDFGIGEKTEEEFVAFIKAHEVSTVQIGVMMSTSVLHPLKVALYMEKIFEQYKMRRYLVYILTYIEVHWSGNCRIIGKIEDLYGRMDGRVQNENYRKDMDIIMGKFPDMEKELLELSELLWKLRYKELETGKQIALFLKNNRITEEMWEFLLEKQNVQAVEYYLAIVEDLLTASLIDFAEITLKQGLKFDPGNEMALCILAELRMERGAAAEAEQLLEKVSEPGELTEKMKKVCSQMKGADK